MNRSDHKVSKTQKNNFLKKNYKYILIGLAGIAALITIFFVIFESSRKKIVIDNDTDRKLEYVRAYFREAEGQVGEEVLFEDITAGGRSTDRLNQIDLSYLQANLRVRFKFEGMEDDLFVDAGYFNDIFNGKVTVRFIQTEEELIEMEVKASNGILPSPSIRCNETYIIENDELTD